MVLGHLYLTKRVDRQMYRRELNLLMHIKRKVIERTRTIVLSKWVGQRTSKVIKRKSRGRSSMMIIFNGISTKYYVSTDKTIHGRLWMICTILCMHAHKHMSGMVCIARKQKTHNLGVEEARQRNIAVDRLSTIGQNDFCHCHRTNIIYRITNLNTQCVIIYFYIFPFPFYWM